MHTTGKRYAHRGQMSDAFITMVFLTLSGGFQDAYTYFMRGKVFANAQTGNLVLMSERIFSGDYGAILRYLVPITAFALGVFVAQRIRIFAQMRQGMHWRQWVLVLEMALLVAVGLLPEALNPLANALVSFVCAMQVQAFRKLSGNTFASTMCIGNLRSGVEAFEAYLRTRQKPLLHNALQYLLMLGCFAVGAGLGSWLSPLYGLKAIWLCCLWLAVAFGLMFIPHEPTPQKSK